MKTLVTLCGAALAIFGTYTVFTSQSGTVRIEIALIITIVGIVIFFVGKFMQQPLPAGMQKTYDENRDKQTRQSMKSDKEWQDHLRRQK